MVFPLRRVVVVGASLAGLRAAETLRTRGFTGTITIVGAERHPPYDRPPLSKKVLSGEWAPERTALRQFTADDPLELQWRLGVAAVGLDVARRVVTVRSVEGAERVRPVHDEDAAGHEPRTDRRHDGGDHDDEIGFDGLIIATGAEARRLAGQVVDPSVVVMRTLDDSLALHQMVSDGSKRVVVIGAGFIGLEVAATVRQLGNDVTVLEGLPAPLIRGLGADIGTVIGEIHAEHGVDLRCNVVIESVEPGMVTLAGGERVSADVIVVGIGVAPATRWLEGSGLELRDGVVCDATLNVGVDGVYAAGDVARWPNGLFGEEMRVEHWTNAAEQGAAAAANLLATSRGDLAEPYSAVPFFWSDQYDRRVQFLGRSANHDEVRIVSGSTAARQFVALYRRGDRLEGVFGLNSTRALMAYRPSLSTRASWDEALAVAGVQTGQSGGR